MEDDVIVIELEEDLMDKVEELATYRGITVNDFIVEAIEYYLTKYHRELVVDSLDFN